MRTLEQIIEAIMNGEVPTHEELCWATLAQSMLANMNTSTVNRQIFKDNPSIVSVAAAANEVFDRTRRCLAQNPRVWVGPDHDYRKPEVQARRKLSLKILDAATKKEPPK